MPNWCSTDYRIKGSMKSIDRITQMLNKSWKNDNGWLGSLVLQVTKEKECKVYSRGWMRDKPNRENKNSVFISCDTAWGELEEWRQFVERTFDDVSIEYLAIEPGCGVYLTNMDEYADKYIVDDLCFGQWDFYPEEGVVSYINENFKQNFSSIDECLEFAADRDDLFINAIEYCE